MNNQDQRIKEPLFEFTKKMLMLRNHKAFEQDIKRSQDSISASARHALLKIASLNTRYFI